MTSPLRRTGPRALLVLTGLGVGVLLCGLAYAGWSTAAAGDAPVRPRSAWTTGGATVEGELLPGSAVTGSLVVRNGSGREQRLTSAGFAPAATSADGCEVGVVFALTVEPSAATPLVVSAGGAATALGWTAFMTGNVQDACQGARFSAALLLDGQRVGEASAVAGRLPAPGRPVGGPATPTRATVRWSAAPGASAYLVERAPAGTTDWAPGCGSATTPLVATSCTDAGLEPGTAHAYRVTAVRGRWRAVGSFSTDVTTQPAR